MILLATCYVCFILILFVTAPIFCLGLMACKKYFNDLNCHVHRANNTLVTGGSRPKNSTRQQKGGFGKTKSKSGFFTNEQNLLVLNNYIFRPNAPENNPDSIPMLYEDLPNNAIVYSNDSVFSAAKTTKHIGQLKLQLSEIEFLTDELSNKGQPVIFVYAGSAPSNHLPNVAELFPGVKFLLVDPHEHVLHFSRRINKVNKFNRLDQVDKEQQEEFKNSPSGKYITHLDVEFHSTEYANQVLYFKQGKTRFNGALINLLTPSGVKRVQKSEELAAREVEDYDELVKYLFESDHTYYIIEDLFTDELAEALGKFIGNNINDTLNKTIVNTPLYFCSDIRTSSNPHSIEMFEEKSNARSPKHDPSPGDIDILWNLAQQLVWLKLMRPKSAMLKFRVPYYNKIEDISALPPYQMETFNKARELGIDFLGNYAAKRLVYLKRDKVYLQAFAEVYSGETRYVVRDYDSVETLNMKEYENKLYYFNNFERALRYHHGHEWCFSKELGVDACGDCAVMIEIYRKYYEKYSDWFHGQRGELRLVILEQIAESMISIDRKLKDKNAYSHSKAHVNTNHGHFYAPFKRIEDITR